MAEKNGCAAHVMAEIDAEVREAVRETVPLPYFLPEGTPSILTIGETAQILRCSEAHAYRMAATGKLRTLQLMGRRVVPRAVIEAMLAAVVAGE